MQKQKRNTTIRGMGQITTEKHTKKKLYHCTKGQSKMKIHNQQKKGQNKQTKTNNAKG